MIRPILAGLTMAVAAIADQPTSVTFTKDVLPILQKHCQSCHRPGQVAPMPLISYQDTRPWAKAMKAAVTSRKMPPWFANTKYGHFANDRSLRQSEIDMIAAWADTGAAEGSPKDGPAPIRWPSGRWAVQPDVVMDLPAHDVPAKGVLEWELIAFPAPFKTDTWVTSMEILPGDPSVVHHICFSFEKHKPTTVYNRYEWVQVPRDSSGNPTPGNSGFGELPGMIIATRDVGSTQVNLRQGHATLHQNLDFCYLPGNTYEDYRAWNAGKLVPAGSDIIVSLHYTTNGKALVDRTKIGFTVAKTAPAKKFVVQGAGEDTPVIAPTAASSRALFASTYNPEFAIPPNKSDYRAPPMDITFLKDVEIVTLRPHAHVRGKSAQYKLVYPDGREEVVLDVPRYDFNWQLSYQTSLTIPKGTHMRFEFTYDNSANNPSNPDPNRWVYQGFQSWEEMMAPNLGFLLDRDADVGGLMSITN
ncbi:MAG: thiol-disulfide isomerase [Bryobacterales bacterium]|nr:thiol-disulfide isomerase [Bryobacterales bacterium]MBV9396841.1 thiol-disulfide isomerase [Bryobacterales bacterium]